MMAAALAPAAIAWGQYGPPTAAPAEPVPTESSAPAPAAAESVAVAPAPAAPEPRAPEAAPQPAPESAAREAAPEPAPIAVQAQSGPDDGAAGGEPDPFPPPDSDEDATASLPPGNRDVIEMTDAKLEDSTILAAIAANDLRFDVSPRALVAMKEAGVSDKVIEAMIATETAGKKAAVAVKPAATPAVSSAEFQRLQSMIERLASQQDAAAAARRAPEPPASAEPAPRAWLLRDGDRTALPPTIAQVALTDDKSGERFKTLQGLAGKALVFVNPAVGGIATSLGGLFHSDNKRRTAIWALAGTAATRELRAHPVFEVEFGNIPGVDPDEYQPAIVRLVPTKDNYRLVAAAKTEGAKATVQPDGPIIEEPVITELRQLGRGRYRASVTGGLPTGEYALVLRPVDKDDHGRRKRRRGEASLGEMFGGVVGQILYFTWDFAVASEPAG